MVGFTGEKEPIEPLYFFEDFHHFLIYFVASVGFHQKAKKIEAKRMQIMRTIKSDSRIGTKRNPLGIGTAIVLKGREAEKWLRRENHRVNMKRKRIQRASAQTQQFRLQLKVLFCSYGERIPY